jgi:hypothetical protein
MARAYSDDLCRKFLEHEQGEGSLAELAERFHVSEGWAAEQDSERAKAQRRFWQREARHIDPAQLIFVDESGVTDDWRRPMLTLSSDKLTFAASLWSNDAVLGTGVERRAR